MNKSNVYAIFSTFQTNHPHPTTELIYRNHFELLVAVILSAQATDKSVNKATQQLFLIANTPEKILSLGEERLMEHIKSIGLYKTKAKNILKMAAMLVALHHSEVPNDRKALEALPGVGRKTANVILNTCFLQPTLAVDTHILRISNRIGLAKSQRPLDVEKQLLKIIPQEFIQNAHHWLILHGRYICTARKPHCQVCPIQKWCEYPNKTPSLKEIA